MKKLILLSIVPLMLFFVNWGCDRQLADVEDPEGGHGTGGTCLGCHSSEDNLKAALGTTEIPIPRVAAGDG